MKKEVLLRPCQPPDEERAIRQLVLKLPPAERERATERRRKRWQWQYHQNPANPGGKPYLLAAEVDGDFAGSVGTVPVRLRTPGGIVLATWGMDFVVERHVRNLGIGHKLLVEWIKNFEASIVLGFTPVSQHVATTVGFEVIHGFTTGKIVLSRLKFAAAAAKNRRYRDLSQLVRVVLSVNRGPADRPQVTASVAEQPPPNVDELWREVAAAYSFCVERDATYLNWRFTSHPFHQYYYIYLQAEGRPRALAIARLTDDDPPLGIISDLIVPPQQKDMTLALLQETGAFLQSRGAYAALVELPPALAVIVCDGCRCSLTKPLSMLAYTANRELHDAGFMRPEAWYISRSDADQDY